MKNKNITLLALSTVVVALVSFVAFEEFGPTTRVYSAAVMIPKTPVQIAGEADYAIVGIVKDMTPIRVDMPNPGDEDRVYTDVTIQVLDDVYSNYGEKTISFRIMGGEASKLKMVAEESPDFRLGETVLVYINQDPDNYTFQGHNYLVGQAQGALSIDEHGNATDKYRGNTFNKDLIVSQSKLSKGI
jgi:hypothetical protein